MKNNRLISFLVVFFVYIIALVVGIVSYIFLPFSFALDLLIADVIATIVVFVFSLIFKNASVYDPYWSVQPIVIVIAYLLTSPFKIETFLISLAIIIWGIRLTANWAYTFYSLNHQDWRYSMLKEKTKAFYPIINFLGIHLVPTLIVYMCVVPVAFMFNYTTSFNVFSVIFFILALSSVILQGVSDIQMHKFKKLKTGKLIRCGLWKYSRHPNYLAEITMWWSVGGFCVTSLNCKPYLLIGALANTLLFLFVSIPMAEKRQASRKEGFEQYKKETRMLLPIKKNKRKS